MQQKQKDINCRGQLNPVVHSKKNNNKQNTTKGNTAKGKYWRKGGYD